MASEVFKAQCKKYLEGIRHAEAVYNPPGVSTSILFADDADACVIGKQFSSDASGRPYGKDEVLFLRDCGEASLTIARGEIYSSTRMLPKAISPDGERVTITAGSREGTYKIADLLKMPLQIDV